MAQENHLNSEELEALREVSKGMMQSVILVDIRNRLIELKYIEQKLGGLVTTAKGKLCLASHRR